MAFMYSRRPVCSLQTSHFVRIYLQAQKVNALPRVRTLVCPVRVYMQRRLCLSRPLETQTARLASVWAKFAKCGANVASSCVLFLFLLMFNYANARWAGVCPYRCRRTCGGGADSSLYRCTTTLSVHISALRRPKRLVSGKKNKASSLLRVVTSCKQCAYTVLEERRSRKNAPMCASREWRA